MSSVLAGAFSQEPDGPQFWHGAQAPPTQQNPSTQFPEAHCMPDEQFAPSARFATQPEPSQYWEALQVWHCEPQVPGAQLVAQTLPLQRKGEHEEVVPPVQDPALLQTRAVVRVEPLQD